MSWLSKIWKGITGSQGLIGSVIGAISGSVQQNKLNDFNAEQAQLNRDFQSEEAQKNRDFQSDEAELARIFNSNEAALQRDWSSQEAERARDWNEEMYEKYNSLSGKIAQAEQAGVNPMFAVTGNAVSPMAANASSPSGAAASGASAGSVGTPSGATATAQFVDIVGQMLGLAKLKSEIQVNEARANKDNTDAETGKITNETLREWNVTQILEAKSRIDYNSENTALVTSKILNTDADTDKKAAELGQIAASIVNMEADTDVKVQQIAVMLSELAKNEASVSLMSAQSKELGQQYENLLQQYGHNEVVNAINEVSLSRDAGVGDHSNGYYRTVSEVKRFINSFFGWFSGGASVVFKK